MDLSTFACRACGSRNTQLLLDLGKLPLANAFISVEHQDSKSHEFRAGLTLAMCTDCCLIQLCEEVPRERLFGSYLWVTSTSETARTYAKWFVTRIKQQHPKGSAQFVVEAASNDGLFLEEFQQAGFKVVGVEPSNLSDEANKRGLETIRDFFGLAIARNIRRQHGPADFIVARNVLGHSSQLQDFVAGVSHLLAPSGILLLEVPYAYFLRNEVQYDTIYHEHLSYFTIESVARLMQRFGLKITAVTFVRMNGGSMLCEIMHEASPVPRNDQALRDFEDMLDLNKPEGWQRFRNAVALQRTQFIELLKKLATEGKTVVGYGAAAKSMTMLNYCGVVKDWLPVIGDANRRKQGLLCPGVKIPVVSPEEIMARNPDYIMIGAWNLKDEIIQFFRNQLGYKKEFIIPLPTPVIEG